MGPFVSLFLDVLSLCDLSGGASEVVRLRYLVQYSYFTVSRSGHSCKQTFEDKRCTRRWSSSNIFYMMCRPLITCNANGPAMLGGGLGYSSLYLQQVNSDTLHLIDDVAEAIELYLRILSPPYRPSRGLQRTCNDSG
jgi:hypothetical protein